MVITITQIMIIRTVHILIADTPWPYVPNSGLSTFPVLSFRRNTEWRGKLWPRGCHSEAKGGRCQVVTVPTPLADLMAPRNLRR